VGGRVGLGVVHVLVACCDVFGAIAVFGVGFCSAFKQPL